jgi:carbon monoxide dehydrogenase subunit G
MELTNDFRVAVPVERAWAVLTDVELIAPCLPGAQLQEVEGDEYRGIVKVKVGPITAQYKGTATIAERDEANRRLVIDASGRDTRGAGNAKATIIVTMSTEGAGTKVDVATDLTVTGKVAQFGRGVLGDVSTKLMGQFVENLERDVLTTAGGGDTSHMGGQYEQALESAVAAAPAPAAAAATPAAEVPSGPRKIDSPEVAPIDLFETAGAPITKRLIPIGIGALVLLILWRILRSNSKD